MREPPSPWFVFSFHYTESGDAVKCYVLISHLPRRALFSLIEADWNKYNGGQAVKRKAGVISLTTIDSLSLPSLQMVGGIE